MAVCNMRRIGKHFTSNKERVKSIREICLKVQRNSLWTLRKDANEHDDMSRWYLGQFILRPVHFYMHFPNYIETITYNLEMAATSHASPGEYIPGNQIPRIFDNHRTYMVLAPTSLLQTRQFRFVELLAVSRLDSHSLYCTYHPVRCHRRRIRKEMLERNTSVTGFNESHNTDDESQEIIATAPKAYIYVWRHVLWWGKCVLRRRPSRALTYWTRKTYQVIFSCSRRFAVATSDQTRHITKCIYILDNHVIHNKSGKKKPLSTGPIYNHLEHLHLFFDNSKQYVLCLSSSTCFLQPTSFLPWLHQQVQSFELNSFLNSFI